MNNPPPKKYRETSARFLLLFLACSMLIGSYFCYDNPQSLSSAFKEEMGLNDTKFNSLYSVYSFPNIVLPLFGGFFIDRIGLNICLIVFSMLLLAG